MSSTPEVPSDSMDLVVGTEVASDEILESVTSQVAPAALAAADSALKEVEVFRTLTASFITDVHSMTGLNWGASIALTCLISNGLIIAMLFYVRKANNVSDPVVEKQKEILYKRFEVNDITLLLMGFQGYFFNSFGYGVQEMIMKVPSLATGGIFWFSDLTAPDATYILPLLSGLNIWILMQLFPWRDSKGCLSAKGMENLVFVLPIVLSSLFMPCASFCFWLPTELSYIALGLATKMQNKK